MTPATVLVVDGNARFLERTGAGLKEGGFRMLARVPLCSRIEC